MIDVPLTRVQELFSTEDGFADAVMKHRIALTNHMMGDAGVARPIADPIVEAVIHREPDTGPVVDRGPDKFVIQAYRVVDDRPKTPEQEQALSVLRNTIK